MNRRSFLSGLLGAATALVLPEPERVRVYSFLPGEKELRAIETHRQLFKGGILKIAIKIKNWEVPGGWIDYVQKEDIDQLITLKPPKSVFLTSLIENDDDRFGELQDG